MDENDGNLDLRGSNITKLPDGLVVNGSLNLAATPIAKLPNGLVVNDFLDISETQIAEIPDDLVIGETLYTYSTPITKLPDNLVIVGDLDISNSRITELPSGLVVGGDLDISDTLIEKLPDDLKIGGIVNYDINMEFPEPCKLGEGEYVEGRYLYVDGIITLIKRKMQIDKYVLYTGKIPDRNIVSDGRRFISCRNLRDGICKLRSIDRKERNENACGGALSSDERLTTRHCGVAVIKNKELLPQAMEKLARYEEAEEDFSKCKLGDSIWSVAKSGKNAEPVEYRFMAVCGSFVIAIKASHCAHDFSLKTWLKVAAEICPELDGIRFAVLRKEDVFPTREDALEALPFE